MPSSSILGRRVLLLATTALAVSAAVPSAALAVGASVTWDGAPVSLPTQTAVRQMAPQVSFSFTPYESKQRFSTAVMKGSVNAGTRTTCVSGRATHSERVFYRGNGDYTAIVTLYSAQAKGCSRKLGERRFAFKIGAGASIQVPRRVLTRRPGSTGTTQHWLSLATNPGASAYEIRYARGAAFDPANGLNRPSLEATELAAQGKVGMSFPRPGNYTVVGRAGADGFYSPWGGAVQVRAQAPFDLGSVRFVDNTGPRFSIRAAIRERSARGKVSFGLRRAGSKRWRGLGGASIRRGAVTKGFRTARGTYVMRFRFRGSATTAVGGATFRFRIL